MIRTAFVAATLFLAPPVAAQSLTAEQIANVDRIVT